MSENIEEQLFGKRLSEIPSRVIKELELRTRLIANESPDLEVRARLMELNKMLRKELRERGMSPEFFPIIPVKSKKRIPKEIETV